MKEIFKCFSKISRIRQWIVVNQNNLMTNNNNNRSINNRNSLRDIVSFLLNIFLSISNSKRAYKIIIINLIVVVARELLFFLCFRRKSVASSSTKKIATNDERLNYFIFRLNVQAMRWLFRFSNQIDSDTCWNFFILMMNEIIVLPDRF